MEENEKTRADETSLPRLAVDTTSDAVAAAAGSDLAVAVSPSMSYATDRETVFHSSAGHATVAETHLIRSVGSHSQSYTEEHWSSEITSFVAVAPPKFIQVIKAYRVLTSDTVSLVVEVASDPPAFFEWFCNEKSVLQDRTRFQVGHGINITRLKVQRPEQGVYKCIARNPAGVSTSYGYISVNFERAMETSQEDVSESKRYSVTYHQAPRFISQVPNLCVTAGSPVMIDVEVDANPPARFSWFVNGKEYRDSSAVEMFTPSPNRSVVRFSLPIGGEYKVVASNVHGSAMSSGFVDIQKQDADDSVGLGADLSQATSMVSSMSHTSRQALNLFEQNYTQRSSSVPRGVRHLESHVEVANTNLEAASRSQSRQRSDDANAAPRPPRGTSRRFLPEPPRFVTQLPQHITIMASERLMLSVDVRAVPAAEITWTCNGFELRRSNNVVVLNEHNKSTLIVHSPVKQGKYKVTAVNDVGSESIVATVSKVGEDDAEREEPPDIVETAVTVVSSHEDDDDAQSRSSFQTVRQREFLEEEEQQEEVTVTEDATVAPPEIVVADAEDNLAGQPIASVQQPSTSVARVQHRITSSRRLPYAPRLTAKPESTIRARSSSCLSAKVVADALPPAAFQWLLNNFELRPSNNIAIINDEENVSEIRFNEVQPGKLTAIARNERGEDRWMGKVVVVYEESPPRATAPARVANTAPTEVEGSHLSEAVIAQVLPMTVRRGETAHLTVKLDPTRTTPCHFDWIINGVRSQDLVNVSVISTYYESTLIVELVDEPNVGEVRCSVSNEDGCQFESTSLLLLRDDDSFEMVPPDLPEESAPKIVEPLHSATFIDGQPMSLRCKIVAIPSAAVIWSKDDINVEEWVINKDVTTQVLDGGVCELLNPECFVEDSGLYKCTATNPHGTAETAAYINVEGVEYVKDREEASMSMSESMLTDDVQIILPPKFSEQLVAEIDSVQQLGYVRLVCTVQTIAPVAITWFKDSVEIVASPKHEVFQFSDGAQILTVHDANDDDCGVYTCTAESEHGVSSSSCNVVVPTREIRETDIDDDIEVVELECQSKEEVTGSTLFEKEQEEYKLLIKVADNVASTLVANVFLDAVREAVKKLIETEDEAVIEDSNVPRFATDIDEYSAIEHETIKMTTTISGYPTPFLEWYFGETKIAISDKISLSYEKGTSSITLRDVATTQGGTYYCHATNVHGTSVLSMRLIVYPAAAVQINVQTSEVSSSTATSTVTTVIEPDDNKARKALLEQQLRAAAEKISEELTMSVTQQAVIEVDKLTKAKPKAKQLEAKVEIAVSVETITTETTPEPRKSPTPMAYEDKVKTIESKLLRVSSQEDLAPIEATNMMLNTALSLKEQHVSDGSTTVMVHQQPETCEQVVTVVESHVEQHQIRLTTTPSMPLKFIDFDTILQRPSTSCESIDRMFVTKSKKAASAQHRIVVLQGISNTFHNAITWSLKKVRKLVGDDETKAYADIEVVKQDESNEQVMTIIDSDTIVPELLQVAAAANKLKLENVSVALIREGDKSHQELVIEYESSIDEPIPPINTSHLVYQQRSPEGAKEHFWSRKSKYSECDREEVQVVAVFVEVDANCPDQNVEIVATVNTPFDSDRAGEDPLLTEPSRSIASESSAAAPQPPKFLRKLVHCQGRVGAPMQLKCVVSGTPTPEVTWSVDDDPIVPNDAYEVVYEDGVCLLRIKETFIEDEGEYCCEAFNVAGRTSTKCFLKLTSPSPPPLPPQIATTTVGTAAALLDEHGASFRRYNETAETAVKVTELLQTDAVQASVVTPTPKPKKAPSTLSVATSTTNLMFCNQSRNAQSVSSNMAEPRADLQLSVCSSSNSWDFIHSDPFPNHESQVLVRDESALYEPRTALLPQKMFYRGQEISVNSVEKTKNDPETPQVANEEPTSKFVETCLQFKADVGVETGKPATLERNKQNGPAKSAQTKNNIQEEVLVDKMKQIERIAQQVEDELSSMSKISLPPNFDSVSTIEEAIFCISDQLAMQKPVSEAQAQANEEILRTALAEMILNHTTKPLHQFSTPIAQLKKRLNDIESSLLEDKEVTEIFSVPTKKGGESRSAVRIKRVPSAHSMRITPITTNLREQLSHLHKITVEHDETFAHHSEKNAISVHELFIRINEEIGTISDLCKKKMTKEGADAVIHVMNSVLQHVISIIQVLNLAQRVEVEAEESTVWYSFEMRPEKEEIIGVVDVDMSNIPTAKPSPQPVAPRRKKKILGNIPEEVVEEITAHAALARAPTVPARTRRPPYHENEQQPVAPPRRRRLSPQEMSPTVVEDPETPKKPPAQPECEIQCSVSFSKLEISFNRWLHEEDCAYGLVDMQNDLGMEFQIPDDIASVQMFCEESDYGTDTERSALLRGTVQFYNRASPAYSEFGNLTSVSADLRSENVEDVFVNVELHSVPSLTSLNSISLKANEAQDDVPIVHARRVTDSYSMEGVSKDLSLTSKFFSDDTLHVVLEEKELSQMVGSSIVQSDDRTNSANTIRETDILSDESYTQGITSYCEDSFTATRQGQHRRVTGIVVYSLLYTLSASVAADNTFDVDIVQEPQKYSLSIKVIEDVIDYTSLTIASDVEDSVMDELRAFSSENLLASNDDLSEATTRTGITVSIVARSLNDGIYASLEEIAWGEVEMSLNAMQTSIKDESKASSAQFNVTVSETNLDENKSLRSQPSFRSSQTSVSEADNTISSNTISIPSYIIKLASTATITCELNNYLPPKCTIEWYCGKEPINAGSGQYDRISHDLLEVLIIRYVEPHHGDLYSLKINDDLFPVAYLIVDTASDANVTILTRPQTQFVMEGHPTSISCSVDDPTAGITWLKDKRPLHSTPRIHAEHDGAGTHRLVFANTHVADQGTYTAMTSCQSVAITLVVEERIDEKEVTVIASGTESEDDDVQEYLVPPGSTATIACELEECEQKRAIRWLRDGADIAFAPGKIEHVQNALKHYLVVHDASSTDSGLYSVVISNVEFRVAHLCVNSLTSTLHGLKRKRISNISLQ